MRSVIPVLMAMLVGLVPSTPANAEDKKDGKNGIEFETKGEKYQGATTIAFGDKLGLSFPSLLTLGARIEVARRDADPVGLMAAASELAVAEKVSGKQADLTAEVLKKEAIDMATMRHQSSELKAVSLMTADEDAKKKLESAAGEAKKSEDELAAKAKRGEKDKGITHELVVYNNTHHTMNIYVNGRYVGHVHAHSHGHFHVHTHGHTHLDARGGGHVFRRHFDRDYSRYNWTLNEH